MIRPRFRTEEVSDVLQPAESCRRKRKGHLVVKCTTAKAKVQSLCGTVTITNHNISQVPVDIHSATRNRPHQSDHQSLQKSRINLLQQEWLQCLPQLRRHVGDSQRVVYILEREALIH